MVWGSPVSRRTAGDSSGAERSGVRSFVTGIRQTGRGLGESRILGDAFSNCLSVTDHQQQTDKQIEGLFDARVLFLCDMLTPIPLHSLGWGGEVYNREGRLQ